MLLVCMGVVASNFQIEAITLKSRIRHMAGWAAATSAAWYAFQIKDETCYVPGYATFSPFKLKWTSRAHRSAAHGSIIPGVISAACIGWISSYYTPKYRYKWAMYERTDLTKSVLFSYRITEKNLSRISITSGAESTGLPLVTLFLGLSRVDKTLGYLIEELEIASSEVKHSSSLGTKIKRLLDDLYKDRVRVRESSHVVKNVDKRAWQKQWEIHNSNQMREKEIAAMKEIASTPQVHFQHHSKGTDGLATTMLAHFLTR